MVECHICNATPALQLPGQHWLCKECFCHGIEKRVRKSLWEQQWLKPGAKVRFVNDETPAAAACKAIMSALLSDFPHSVVDADDSIAILPDTMDAEVSRRFAALVSGKENDKEHEAGALRPLHSVTAFEAKLYADAKGLKYAYETPLNPHIESLEQKYPGTKFALLKSFQKF